MSMNEIAPMQYSKLQTRKITYKRIKKKALSKEVLESLWRTSNAKKEPTISEDNQLLSFQYPKKPVLIISKKTGRIYFLHRETRYLKHQAGLILRILDEFGFVEGFERKTVYKEEPKIEWVENDA